MLQEGRRRSAAGGAQANDPARSWRQEEAQRARARPQRPWVAWGWMWASPAGEVGNGGGLSGVGSAIGGSGHHVGGVLRERLQVGNCM